MISQAFIFSGCGAKVAFQYGCLAALFKSRQKGQVNPQFFAGTSAGALLAAFLAQAEETPEALAKKLCEFGEILLDEIHGDESVSTRRFLPALSLFHRKSLRCTFPLKTLIHRHISAFHLTTSDRVCLIPTYNLSTRQTEAFSGRDPHLLDIILASASYPFFFPPVLIDGELHCDGGIKEIVPSRFVTPWRPREIFVFLGGGMHLPENPPIKSILGVFSSIMEGATGDPSPGIERLKAYKEKNPEVPIWVFYDKRIEKYDPLEFNPRKIREMIKIGSLQEPVPIEVF